MLLAIDTSAGTGVAVVADGGVLAEAAEAGTRRHAEAIGTLLAAALAEAGVTPGEIDGVVAGMGPGPFTGLRVGIAAARAFAFARGIPVLPMVSHDAVAFAQPDRVLVVTDARRREVAWSLYDPDLVRLDGPNLADREGFTGDPSARRIDAAEISAASLGLAAERLLAAGRALGPAQPLYLRPPDAVVPAGMSS